jgi:hypothetical protein
LTTHSLTKIVPFWDDLQEFNNTLTLMTIPVNKYQGAGNDFIIIDNRQGIFDPSNTSLIKRLCDRRFGIGADGLMLISDGGSYDYEMNPTAWRVRCAVTEGDVPPISPLNQV